LFFEKNEANFLLYEIFIFTIQLSFATNCEDAAIEARQQRAPFSGLLQKGNRMRLHRTTQGVFVEQHGQFFSVQARDWDELLCDGALAERLQSAISGSGQSSLNGAALLPPVQSQDVWAAGVTYYRSRNARIEESKDAGGGNFYDRIYTAPRPELFFKSAGHKVVGDGAPVRIRSDASWSVPEPELTLVVNREGRIIGYTIGNDMSSRDIEGLNPLYLPQAKVYDGSCAIGPGILLSFDPMPSSTEIKLEIFRTELRLLRSNVTLKSWSNTFTGRSHFHTVPS
jgi:2-dehydro-3-deoxy-D-arabinonate dehydratase